MSLRDLCRAWWTVSGNGDPARIPASELLSSCAHGDGTPDSIIDAWADHADRWRLTAGGADDRRFGRHLVMNTAGHASSIAGEEVIATGKAAPSGVRAPPCWRRISIRCARSPSILACRLPDHGPVDRHLGASVKIWAKVRGVPVGVLATGGGESAKPASSGCSPSGWRRTARPDRRLRPRRQFRSGAAGAVARRRGAVLSGGRVLAI
jgi:hypothetical protein